MTPREFFDRAMCDDSKFILAMMIKEVEEECEGDLLQYFIEDLKGIAERWIECETAKKWEAENERYLNEVNNLHLHFINYGIPQEVYDEMLNEIERPIPPFPIQPPDSFYWALEKLEQIVITDSVSETSTKELDTSTGLTPEWWEKHPKINTPEAWEIWRQAKEYGLIDDDFKWLKGLQLLACFAREISLRFDLGKGVNNDGTKRINWKIFEDLFNIGSGKLRSNYNDIQKTGVDPSEIEIINKIFPKS